MITAALVCAGLVSVLPANTVVSADDLAAYEAARATVGRDAGSHVKLALWCEAHGLQAERTRHLALAVLNNPAHPTARGLMGLVAFRDRWRRPNAVADQVKADESLLAALAEYNGRRERAPDTADAQWKLALWCEEQGLKAEAQAHLAAVVRLDPSREAAWKHLGYKKVNGRWATDAQVEAEKTEAEAQKQADKHWRPLLTKWRGWLAEKGRREEAQRLLSSVDDPRSVPSVVSIFGASNAEHQAVAVQVLGQIDAPASSRALAYLAIFGRTNEVRRVATESLKGRDAREYAGQLIALLRDPIKYEVRPVGGPGSPGALFVQGQRFNVQRLYTPASLPRIPGAGSGWLSYDENGLPILHHTSTVTMSTGRITGEAILQQIHQQDPATQQLNQAFAPNVPTGLDPLLGSQTMITKQGDQINIPSSLDKSLEAAIGKVAHDEHKSPSQFGFDFTVTSTQDTQIRVGQMMLEAQKSAITAQMQLQSDVATVEAYNAGVNEGNTRVAQVLKNGTGQDLRQDREAWKGWWVDQLGYSYKRPYEKQKPVPTVVENVPIAYTPQPVLPTVDYQETSIGFERMSCFGAGTPVRTLLGTQPIESLRVGDQVLTQDLVTGGLGYKPILVVHHNPPSPTFLVKVDGDTIVSSPFHRFWKAGKGWVMARNLKAGDTLRLLDAPATVESVEPGPVQPVYNLDVAEDHDFFAGRRSALVHDNSLPDLRQAPFDADPGLSVVRRESK